MCGRYRLRKRAEEIARAWDIEEILCSWEGSEEIFPSQDVPVIVERHGKRKLVLMKWGLVPRWAKEFKRGVINARQETLNEKPTFKHLVDTNRCLVPADGFFEWRDTSQGKERVLIDVDGGQVFAFEGIWDGWKDAEGKVYLTFAILTAEAQGLMREIHDRMPVIHQMSVSDLSLHVPSARPG